MSIRRRSPRPVVLVALAILAVAAGGCSSSGAGESADPATSEYGPTPETSADRFSDLGEAGCAYLSELAADDLSDLDSDTFSYTPTSNGWTCLPGSDSFDGPVSISVAREIPGGSKDAAVQQRVDTLSGGFVLAVDDGPWSVSLEVPDGPVVSFTRFDESGPWTLDCEVPNARLGVEEPAQDVRTYCTSVLAWLED